LPLREDNAEDETASTMRIEGFREATAILVNSIDGVPKASFDTKGSCGN